MKKWKAKRDGFVGLTFYHEGSVITAEKNPDTGVFAETTADEADTAIHPAPNPAGNTITQAEADAIGKTSRAKRASRGK